MRTTRRRRSANGVGLLVLALMAACGRPSPDDVGDGGPTPDPRTDKTPLNQELDLGFDGEMPDLVAGQDGTLHMVYRVVAAPQAKLHYVRKQYGDNLWSQPVEVPGSSNSAYRWFAFPDIAVGPDNRVHILWAPEPYDHNGLFYASCVACDGNDWSGGQPDQRFRRLTDDLVEFFEICVAPSNTVHVAAMQLYRRRETGGFDETDQMVHYFSNDGGKNWGAQQILNLAFEDLNLRCNGEDVDLIMRFKDLRHSRYVLGSDGARRWSTRGLQFKGAGLSEMNPFYTPDGTMTGFAYSVWNEDGPFAIYHSVFGPGDSTYQQLSTAGTRRPNNLVADENSSGQRVAVWADNETFLHWSGWNNGAWTPDELLSEKIRALAPEGLGRLASWQYSPGHGWNGRILWPAMSMAQQDGDFHIVYRTTVEYTEVSTTKLGRFHYVRLQPFDGAAP
jgi:hypothetical protein